MWTVQRLKPLLFEELAMRHDQFIVGYINAQKHTELRELYGHTKIPYLAVQVKDEVEGIQSSNIDDVREFINNHIDRNVELLVPLSEEFDF